MKKEVIVISSAVFAGAVSRGITGNINMSNTAKIAVNGIVFLGSGYAAVKVVGIDTKASIMRGAAFGIAIAQAGELMKSIFSSPKVAAKLNAETTVGRFLQKSVGLSGAVNGLNGYTDEDGNYHEDGLGGYIDISGNFVEYGLNGMEDEDEGLGYYDEDGNFISDGLNGFDDEDGLNAYEEEGELNAYINEDGAYML